jgi:hypothetical protein
MNVGYLGPLQRAVARARSMLFKPFRLEFWLTLGFAAFLSEWLSGGWGQASWQHRTGSWRHGGMDASRFDLHDLLPALVWGPLLAGLILVAILVAIALIWLGARGKFVFLDDVVRGRAAIVEPWHRLARLGNSLFLWRLGFAIVSGLLMIALVLGTIGTAVLGWLGFREPVAMAPPILGGVVLAILAGLLIGFVSLLLDEFVVPLMYRHGVTATEAWRRFLPLLRAHPGPFVLYALFVLLLVMLVIAAVTVLGLATCCVGFFLMLAPYVGQVVLLPLYVTYRGLGPEFLAQFGPEFDAFAGADPHPAAPPESVPPAGPAPGTSA